MSRLSIHDYRCEDCRAEFEVYVWDDEDVYCKDCGSNYVVRELSAVFTKFQAGFEAVPKKAEKVSIDDIKKAWNSDE